jgi:hypothetical protein
MGFGPEQVLNELGGLAKRIYDTSVIDEEQRLTITYDELPTKEWNIKGDGWYGDAHLIRSSSFKFANPTEGLPQDTFEVNKQFTIRNTELFAQVPFTKDFLVKLVGGVTSFEDYTYKVEDLIRSSKKNLNQSCYIGPTNARCALSSSPSAATSFTVDNAQYLFTGMAFDIYSSGGTLVVSNVVISGISGLTITCTPAITATSTDVIYLHEENVNAGSGKGFTSIPFQCDDGTDYSVTFEGLSRTTYPAWRGNRIDASSAPLTNDLLQRGQNAIRENGGNDYMTEDYVNFVHMDSVRRYLQIVIPQKRYIDASKYDSGMEKPNMLEWNGKPIVIDPDCGKRDWIMYNRAHGGKMEIAPLAADSMLGGTTMKWRNGYMQGVVVTYFSGNLGSNKPNANLIIRNLATL